MQSFFIRNGFIYFVSDYIVLITCNQILLSVIDRRGLHCYWWIFWSIFWNTSDTSVTGKSKWEISPKMFGLPTWQFITLHILHNVWFCFYAGLQLSWHRNMMPLKHLIKSRPIWDHLSSRTWPASTTKTSQVKTTWLWILAESNRTEEFQILFFSTMSMITIHK